MGFLGFGKKTLSSTARMEIIKRALDDLEIADSMPKLRNLLANAIGSGTSPRDSRVDSIMQDIATYGGAKDQRPEIWWEHCTRDEQRKALATTAECLK